MGARLAQREIARTRGISAVRPPPVLVQSSTTSNPTPSYEAYLLNLLFPAIIHFALCLSVAGALGRELRDGTAGEWLRASGDALLPAVEALKAAGADGASLEDALGRSEDAAKEGMEATIPLKALKGRASYLGERSIGHQDPGATSSYLLIRAAHASFGG